MQAYRNQGLSPRVRGSLGPDVKGRVPLGPIPACAGQPRGCWLMTCRSWAYPRVCGAAFGVDIVLATQKGLSPRVRGSRAD